MSFCAPLWRLLFKGGQDAPCTKEEASRGKQDKETRTVENELGPKVLTKEEKLKEQRRKDIEQLRETLRLRRELLDGTVEVAMKKGTIEGYQIRVVRGPSQGVIRATGSDPQHTKESMEKFSRFIESKIKQMQEQSKVKDKACDNKKQENIPKDPVQDALIKRLLELQAERVVNKKEQSEHSDQPKTKSTPGKNYRKKPAKKCTGENSKAGKAGHKDESNKSKDVRKNKKVADKPNEKHKPEKDERKGKTIETPKKSSKEDPNTEKTALVGSPKTEVRSEGAELQEKQHESTDVAEPHDGNLQKSTEHDEIEGHRETPNVENNKGNHEGADINTESDGQQHPTDGGKPTVEEHKKSTKLSRQSKDKK